MVGRGEGSSGRHVAVTAYVWASSRVLTLLCFLARRCVSWLSVSLPVGLLKLRNCPFLLNAAVFDLN